MWLARFRNLPVALLVLCYSVGVLVALINGVLIKFCLLGFPSVSL